MRILDSNEMTMTQVVKDRVNVLRTFNEMDGTIDYKTIEQWATDTGKGINAAITPSFAI